MINIDLAAAKSEALFNISKFLKENIKSSDTKRQGENKENGKNNNNRSN